MSEHMHTWVHRRALTGRIVERCFQCSRARVPKLSSDEAHKNEMGLLSREFKRLYGPHIFDMVPAPPRVTETLTFESPEWKAGGRYV